MAIIDIAMSESFISQVNPWWRDGTTTPWLLPEHRRTFQRVIFDHLRTEVRRALVVRGPRQVGKSTALKHTIVDLLTSGVAPANVAYLDFSDPLAATLTPRDIARLTPPGFEESQPHFLLLDEIGRAPDWPSWLKQAVDAGRHRIVVTDSSSLLLRAATSESGLGRWDELLAEPLTYAEFLQLQAKSGEDMLEVEKRLPAAFEQYLAKGGFPEAITHDSLPVWWRRVRDDTADRAIGRDLRERAGVADTARPTLLFRYLLEASGSMFDAKKMGQRFTEDDEAVDPRTVLKWVNLLEQTMLITRLERRETTPGRRLTARQHPKLYASDHGLVFAFSGSVRPLDDPRERGRAYEALVFRHIREVGRALEMDVRLHRPKRGKREDDEVDFVATGSGTMIAIEVTHTSKPERRRLTNLARLAADLGANRTLCIYGGLAVDTKAGVDLVPLRQFALEPESWLSK